MSTIAERIAKELGDEKKAARAEGILDAVKQIVEKMIKMNFEDIIIKQATGAKISEIEKIRKELNNNK